MGAAIAAAAMRRREQQVIDDFRAAGATSPDRAQSYTAMGGDNQALNPRLLFKLASLFFAHESPLATSD